MHSNVNEKYWPLFSTLYHSCSVLPHTNTPWSWWPVVSLDSLGSVFGVVWSRSPVSVPVLFQPPALWQWPPMSGPSQRGPSLCHSPMWSWVCFVSIYLFIYLVFLHCIFWLNCIQTKVCADQVYCTHNGLKEVLKSLTCWNPILNYFSAVGPQELAEVKPKFHVFLPDLICPVS